jgi:hypothetical protein
MVLTMFFQPRVPPGSLMSLQPSPQKPAPLCALLIGIDSVIPKLLQLGLDVFLLESIILDSGEHLSIDLPALGIAIFDLNPVVSFVDERSESSICRHI